MHQGRGEFATRAGSNVADTDTIFTGILKPIHFECILRQHFSCGPPLASERLPHTYPYTLQDLVFGLFSEVVNQNIADNLIERNSSIPRFF